MTDRNANRPGYKKTTVDLVPPDWHICSLSTVAQIQTGVAKGRNNLKNPVSLPYLRVANVQDGHVDLSEIKELVIEADEIRRYALKTGDVLFTEGGDFDKLGRGCVWDGQITPCLHQNHIFAVRCDESKLIPYVLASLASSPYGRRYFALSSKQSTNLASINSTQLKAFPIPLPPLPEQKKIAEILSTWDEAIEHSRALITAAKRRKKALMQQMLTGKKRLPKFPGGHGLATHRYFGIPADWQYPRLADIATECSERNTSRSRLTVLSCSKHRGFVESTAYFGKQIFSEDTSNYKVVRRGCFGFPSNHVEEGSIGLLLTHDAGMVSPIYTVFKTVDAVLPEFLFAVFKTETYRHIFQISTSGSVDRRGSLRWGEFALIRVPLPSLPEQRAIAAVLTTADEEIKSLEAKCAALERQKRGLIQKLLTGEARVKS